MSNISKIKLSGTTYTLKDNNATKTSEVTQAQYDALVSAGTVDTNTFYIITDETPVDISNYYTSAQTNAAITAAVSGKVDTSAITSSVTSASTDSEIPTAKAVYDAIPTGGTGGGKAVSGGTNISITTGETADTINCTLPISTDGNYSGKGIILGNGNDMRSRGACSIVGGTSVSASTNASFSVGFGKHINLSNEAEFCSGKYSVTNRASSTFGDSGNTLFSVGNGTADNARHNAFEIRQNGDIYLTKDGQDVKLQDALGGGGSSYTAGDGIDITNDVISVTGKTDSSAFTAYTAATDTALASKQTTLTAGTGISIVDNVISATGGKAIEAGRGISVTTGETADTVSFNLPISAGTSPNSLIIGESTNISNENRSIATGYKTKAQQSNAFAQGYKTVAGQEQSHAEGYETKAYGVNSHSEGRGTSAMTSGSHAEGLNTKTSNSYEHASGQFNVSSSASATFGDSGNTLFSVGNGTANNARHNAFEIRQNGDIYITSGGTDIKLQDNLGGGSASSAITSGDTNAVAGGAVYDRFDEVEQVTARALNELSEADEVAARALVDLDSRFGGLKLVKITQSAYDALTTKDSNTLYVITS